MQGSVDMAVEAKGKANQRTGHQRTLLSSAPTAPSRGYDHRREHTHLNIKWDIVNAKTAQGILPGRRSKQTMKYVPRLAARR
jgi:hypothetical protein